MHSAIYAAGTFAMFDDTLFCTTHAAARLQTGDPGTVLLLQE